MQILNTSKNTRLADQAHLADSFLSRLIGLLNRPSLPSGEGLIITNCRSIHMFFMRFAIDVIFVDKNNIVVGLVKGIKPFCLSPIFFRSDYAVELPVGVIESSKTQVGDHLQMILK